MIQHIRTQSLNLSHRGGFTLTEIMITLPIMLVISGAIVSFTLSGQELARVENLQGHLDQVTMRAVERVVDDIRRTGGDQMVPNRPRGYERRIELLPVVDIDADSGVVYAVSPVIYDIETVPNEIPFNGIDDNNNGLIDEGQLVRISSEGVKAVLATGVKGWDSVTRTSFNGFRFRRTDATNRLRVALTIQRVDGKGKVLERTYSSAVSVRN